MGTGQDSPDVGLHVDTTAHFSSFGISCLPAPALQRQETVLYFMSSICFSTHCPTTVNRHSRNFPTLRDFNVSKSFALSISYVPLKINEGLTKLQCYKVECCFNKVEPCFDNVAVATVSNENFVLSCPRHALTLYSSFRQSGKKLSMFSLFRLCRKDNILFDIVAKNGNNVEATFDFVESIVRLQVAFDNFVSTLLQVWTGPKTTNALLIKLTK